MTGVKPEPGPALDDLGNPRQGPQVGRKPVGHRPAPERPIDSGHRHAVMGVTSKARATAAWDSPRANRRAASNRRASSTATSAFLAMSQHGIVAPDAHNFIQRGSFRAAPLEVTDAHVARFGKTYSVLGRPRRTAMIVVFACATRPGGWPSISATGEWGGTETASAQGAGAMIEWP